MKKKRILAASFIGMLTVGCEKSVEQADANGNQSKRVISEALIASCPTPILAKRSTDSASPIIDMESNKGMTAVVSIYKQNGSVVQDSLVFAVSALDTSVSNMYFSWNGKDSSGHGMPNGNYFFYYTILDSLNSVRLRDSSCVSLVNSGSE